MLMFIRKCKDVPAAFELNYRGIFPYSQMLLWTRLSALPSMLVAKILLSKILYFLPGGARSCNRCCAQQVLGSSSPGYRRNTHSLHRPAAALMLLQRPKTFAGWTN